MSPRPRGWVRRLVDNVEERGDEEEKKSRIQDGKTIRKIQLSFRNYFNTKCQTSTKPEI